MDSILSKWDHIKQSSFPTVMVPQKSPLVPCRPGQTRLLMACDGLYLETRREWGGLLRRLWKNPRHVPLPYGPVEERDDFDAVLHRHVMPIVSEFMVPMAAEYAEEEREWAGFVIWDGTGFRPVFEETLVTKGSVKFLTSSVKDLPPGQSLVADVHSHNTMSCFFSTADNASDAGGVKISIVLGNYRNEEGPRFDWLARYCIEGFFLGDDGDLSLIEKYLLKEEGGGDDSEVRKWIWRQALRR